jgi:hypothetical protein
MVQPLRDIDHVAPVVSVILDEHLAGRRGLDRFRWRTIWRRRWRRHVGSGGVGDGGRRRVTKFQQQLGRRKQRRRIVGRRWGWRMVGRNL